MKNLWNEFKDFAFTGNVMDMAVGVILGGALKDVVTALVNMLMGVLSAIIKIQHRWIKRRRMWGQSILLMARLSLLLLISSCLLYVSSSWSKRSITLKRNLLKKKKRKKSQLRVKILYCLKR